MDNVMDSRFARDEIRRNFYKGITMVLVLVAIVMVLSYYIGRGLGDPTMGYMIGIGVCVIVLPLQILTAKWAILGMSRGRAANPEVRQERRAQQILEGLAISAGLQTTPKLYIIPSSCPNAFASGMSEKSAFVGVTEGLLDMMNDQQLEGVIAHEIAHIVHRDIVLNQLVVGLISVILLLAFILERLAMIKSLFGDRRDNRDSGGIGAIILVLVLISLLVRPLAMLICSLLQMSISRTREYAADAYAVQLCSYNEGLAGALEKLGGEKYSKKDIDSLGGSELACMYINFPGAELFSTHPPLEERINRLRNMY